MANERKRMPKLKKKESASSWVNPRPAEPEPASAQNQWYLVLATCAGKVFLKADLKGEKKRSKELSASSRGSHLAAPEENWG